MSDRAPIAPIFNVRRHSGAAYENGAVHRAHGVNEAMPDVEVVHGREEGSGWAGGHSNYSESESCERHLAQRQSSFQARARSLSSLEMDAVPRLPQRWRRDT